MAYGISPYLANNWLNMLRGTAYTPPGSVWAKLHIGDPGAAGANNPSSQTTRVQVTWSVSSGGLIILSNTPEFTLTATETAQGCSYWDNATAGNFLFSAPAGVSKGGVAGDIIRIATIPVSLTPLAA